MTNTTHNLTRRQTLVGIGIASATVAAPVSAIASVGSDSAAWDRAMRHFKHCEAAVAAFEPHWNRAEKAHMEALKSVPHWSVTYPDGRTRSTADTLSCKAAIYSAEKSSYIEFAALPYHRADVALADLYKKRQSAIEQIEQIEHSTGFERVNSHYDELVDRMCDARWALMAMPAPHNAALLWKLEYLMEDTAYADDCVEQPIADMRRLLGA